jgi:hypothetical protein
MSCVSVNKNCGSVNQGAKNNADADYASAVRNNSAVQPDPGYEQVRSQNGSDTENHDTNKHSNSSEDDVPEYDQVTFQDRCSGSYFSVMRDSDNQLMSAHPSYEMVHSKG